MSVTTHPLSIRIAAWIAGRDGVEHGDVLLDRKRVYILPTRAGLLFAAAMLMLLVGAINYGLQLGFLLTFLVTSMAVIGMYHTHRNLARITLRGHHVDNVFAGDLASFQVSLSNPTAEARFALHGGAWERESGRCPVCSSTCRPTVPPRRRSACQPAGVVYARARACESSPVFLSGCGPPGPTSRHR